MKVTYNSYDSFHKFPFGAIANSEEVKFTLTADDGIYIDSIRIIVLKNDFVYTENYFSYDGFHDYRHNFVCTLKFSETGIYNYYFLINSEKGQFAGVNQNGKLILKACDENFKMLQYGFFMWQLTVYDKDFKTPDWANNCVMYQIFPDRFKKSEKYFIPETVNKRTIHEKWDDIPEFIYDVPEYTANDFFCGNLKGIEQQLPYLSDLGIDAIYLNPIFESGANHRYSTADYKNIDPYLGTNEDFKSLCENARSKNIRIILDGVFSHTGDDSLYFNKFGNYPQKGAFQGADSPYYTWYNFGETPDEYECWWGFKNLPNVNELDKSYMDFITNEENGVLKFWNDLGASGWRLDVADELPDEFIDAVRQSVKSINSDALLIGEVWEDATTKISYGVKRRYLLGKQLDSVMNYPFKNAILDFALGGSGVDFINSVMPIVENYPPQSLNTLMNSISTHDTIRAITALNEKNIPPREQGKYKMTNEEYEEARKKLLMSVFLQFSLPGMPCIYYGDEVGLEGYRDPYNRMTYPYGKEDFSILDFHKEIIKFRKKYKEDFSSVMLPVSADSNTVCFKRGKLLFIANNGDAGFVKVNNIDKRVYGDKNAVFNEYGVIMSPFSFAVFTIK